MWQGLYISIAVIAIVAATFFTIRFFRRVSYLVEEANLIVVDTNKKVSAICRMLGVTASKKKRNQRAKASDTHYGSSSDTRYGGSSDTHYGRPPGGAR